MVRTAEVLQAQARKAGFAPTIRVIDPPSLITVLRSRDFDVAMSPWSGRPDPDGNMFGWFTPDGPFNFSGYRNEEVADLLQRARVESNRGLRAPLYRRAQALIAADAPLLFLSHPSIIQAASSNVIWDQHPDGALRLGTARLRT
jgi:peptide/nickel transport system substrate-binding protein